MSETVRGFILQPTYRIESGRPVVHLYGTLESGDSFLVRDTRFRPHFWIRRTDAERADELGAGDQHASTKKTMHGEVLVRVEVPRPSDAPPLRNRLQDKEISCYEADVPFAIRYLIEHGVRGTLEIEGHSRKGKRGGRVFEDPVVRPCRWSPTLSVLSFDIETDPKAQTLLSIALVGCGTAEVLLFTPAELDTPAGAVGVRSQEELLELFVRRVRELDPDVLTGWNIVDFDLPVLMRRAEALGVRLELGRGRGGVRRRTGRSRQQSSQVSIPGRAVLDGLALLRGAFIRMDEYSLDAVAKQVLGEGKTVTGRQRAHEILRMFREERRDFVDYNLTDARLVLDILDELDLVELAVERSRLTGMPPHRVSSSIAAFDFLYISELRRRDLVAPSVDTSRPSEDTGGGEVLEPIAGLYQNVVVLDFKSLYPSLIRTFHIDPLGFVEHPQAGADLIRAPNGAHFARQPGILTQLLDELFPRRERAREEGDSIAAYAIKILMNSFFGVLGTPLCRFYSPAIANAITSFGREILLWTRRRIELEGMRVLYGDTDSLFVDTNQQDEEAARRIGGELCELLDRELARHIEEIWRTESRLEIELDKVYLRLFLPHVRHGTRGARKRYAGLVRDGDGTRVVFTGLEAVRRDWTELARRTQRELFERLFRDDPVEEFVRQRVAALRDGELDDLLVYRKALRKDLDEYTSTSPPHVVAARKMSATPGRRVAYVVTIAGPEPAHERSNPYDYEHYVDKQVRPVTEPVLDLLGLDFAKVIGDDAQLDLF